MRSVCISLSTFFILTWFEAVSKNEVKIMPRTSHHDMSFMADFMLAALSVTYVLPDRSAANSSRISWTAFQMFSPVCFWDSPLLPGFYCTYGTATSTRILVSKCNFSDKPTRWTLLFYHSWCAFYCATYFNFTVTKMITVTECIVVTYFHKFTSDIAVPCVQQNKSLRKYKL